jgi:hypothetical protein
MNENSVRLYWRNVTAEVIGKGHGITHETFTRLADRTKSAIVQVNRDRKEGKTPYRACLMKEHAERETARAGPRGCENLVVLDLGSALSNIAQTRKFTHVQPGGKHRERPRLFVLDNGPRTVQPLFQVVDRLDRRSGTWSATGETPRPPQFMITPDASEEARSERLPATGHCPTDASRDRRISDDDGCGRWLRPTGGRTLLGPGPWACSRPPCAGSTLMPFWRGRRRWTRW